MSVEEGCWQIQKKQKSCAYW